jgi:centromere-localized protein 2
VDGAVKALDAEIERLKSEEAELLESTKQIIGGLSDLRYGKFANTQIKDEVLDSLTALQDVCNRPS